MYIVQLMNFQRIIKDLIRTGLTEAAIAKRCDCTQPAIHRIKATKGAGPSYSVGVKLVELHESEMQLHKERLNAA